MKLGSIAFKARSCRRFLDSHFTNDPVSLPWPQLNSATIDGQAARQHLAVN